MLFLVPQDIRASTEDVIKLNSFLLFGFHVIKRFSTRLGRKFSARERETRASRRYGGKKRNEISKYLYSPCASKHRKNINHKLYVNHKSEALCEEKEGKKMWKRVR